VRRGTSPQRLVVRSRIVLLAAKGLSDRVIAAQLTVARQTVRLWRCRYMAEGAAALSRDAPGRGRKPKISREHLVSAMSKAATDQQTVRALAKQLGVGPSSVHRALAKHGVSDIQRSSPTHDGVRKKR
jgi:transposase